MLTTHHTTTIQIVINQRKSQGHLPFTHFRPKFVQGYISPSNLSFHSSSGTNKCFCRPMLVGRQQFCGNTVNMFAEEDQRFQWSKAYFYYSSHFTENEVIWTSGIARAGYVPEVFDYKEVVSWCTKKYIPGQRIIPLRDHSPVSLSPQLFYEMLKLLKPTLTFRGKDCNQFLENHNNGLDILANFLKDSTTVPEDITKL
jgi:hypothetical protein